MMTSRKRTLSMISQSSSSDGGVSVVVAAAGGDKRSRSSSPVHDIIASPTTTPSTPVVAVPLPSEGHQDPDQYLLQLVQAQWPQAFSVKDDDGEQQQLCIQSALELGADYFPTITEEQMSRYNMKVVNMARANDVEGLRNYHAQAQGNNDGNALDCFNRFGEGLLNMACRRGFTEMFEFLLSPAIDLPVRVRDDYGRTPVHDACWNPEPQLEICTTLLQRDPSLFLIADKRGYTPFQYARESDWPTWREFLYKNRESLIKLTEPEIVERFSRKAATSN